jgi:hypothetical protein
MAFPTNWGCKCPLVIQASKVDATLANFPVLLTKDTLPSSMFDADGSNPALSGGGDIRFSSDAAGNTQLSCEVVTFTIDNDPANGVAEIWVKVPSISSSSNTTIYVWWDKAGESQPAIDVAFGAESVWDSNFKMVQHMEDTTTSTITDSTSNDKDGTKKAANEPIEATEKIGKAQDFDGSDDYITISGSLDPTADFTLSAWINGDSFAAEGGTYRTILAQQDGTGTGRTLVGMDEVNNKPMSFLGGMGASYGLSALSTGTYYFITVTYDASAENLTIYTDDDAGNVTGSIVGEAASGNLVIGAHKGLAKGRWDGGIDEVRISDSIRLTGWRKAEYNNQNDPSTFVVEGAASCTTLAPTTLASTTLAPTTLAPTTVAPTTLAPTTLAPTTLAPTTLAPTTLAPTTLAPTTEAPTTPVYTTVGPTTVHVATTPVPTTAAPTSLAPTTTAPTSLPPTSLAPTTLPPTTLAPTTSAPTSLAPTTLPSTTTAPTTVAPTTLAPTTLGPTTIAPTTIPPTTLLPTTGLPEEICIRPCNSPMIDEILCGSPITKELTCNGNLC